jgi:hypothetical protein
MQADFVCVVTPTRSPPYPTHPAAAASQVRRAALAAVQPRRPSTLLPSLAATLRASPCAVFFIITKGAKNIVSLSWDTVRLPKPGTAPQTRPRGRTR